MTKEAITERLKFLTELLRLVWISLLAIGGGTVGLFLGPYDFWRYFFAGVGVAASIGVGVMVVQLYRKIERLLTQLEKR